MMKTVHKIFLLVLMISFTLFLLGCNESKSPPDQITTPKQEPNPDSTISKGQYILNTDLFINGPNKSWWINSSSRTPNVIIVLSSTSSESEVRAANILAKAIINTSGNSEINTEDIVKQDIDFNPLTNRKNVVLLSGPLDNSIVKDLVDMGISNIDYSKSSGEWEWISNPFDKGYDVLIIYHGKDDILSIKRQFIVREIAPVPISYLKPTRDHYYKRSMIVDNSFYKLSDKDGDGVPDIYDNNPTGGGGTSYTYFSWDDRGVVRTWELEAPSDVVDFYDKVRPQFYDVNQWITSFVVPNDKIVQALAQAFNETSQGYNEEEKISLVLKFVQKLEYSKDSTIAREDPFYDYPRYPTQTLFDRTGDCEDTSILLASILKEMNKEVCLINPPGHMATGVSLIPFNPKYYYPRTYSYNGIEYYYCETTGENWRIGEIPEPYININSIIYKIN